MTDERQFISKQTALIGVTAMILISQLINENKILQYFGRISLIILCIHGPVYRIVVKIVSIPLQMPRERTFCLRRLLLRLRCLFAVWLMRLLCELFRGW